MEVVGNEPRTLVPGFILLFYRISPTMQAQVSQGDAADMHLLTRRALTRPSRRDRPALACFLPAKTPMSENTKNISVLVIYFSNGRKFTI